MNPEMTKIPTVNIGKTRQEGPGQSPSCSTNLCVIKSLFSKPAFLSACGSVFQPLSLPFAQPPLRADLSQIQRLLHQQVHHLKHHVVCPPTHSQLSWQGQVISPDSLPASAKPSTTSNSCFCSRETTHPY